MNRTVTFLSLGALGLMACGPNRDFDLDPPRVLEVTPAGPLVRVDVAFRARFSEAMNALSVTEETVALVPRAQVSAAFLADFNNPPLSDTRKAQLLPVTLSLSDDETEVSVAPNAPLEPRTAYSLLLSAGLRDQAGNPLFGAGGDKATFRLDITTDDGPPALLGHDVTSAQTPLVPPNRKRFSVTFNQPVRNLTLDNMRLEAQGGAPSPVIEALEIDEDRSRATLVLAAPTAGCERLSPSADYALVLGPGIADDEGEVMAEESIDFSTGAACDLEPNRVVGQPLVVAGEVAASIRFDTSKASSTEVRYGLAGGPLDCLGRTCPVRGAPSLIATPGVSPPRFVHALDVAGLEVDVEYDFQVRAEDPVGFVATAEGSFQTAPLPKVAVNELVANAPAGISPDANGEFVELYNYGDEPVDLSGFAITLDGGAVAGGSTCELPTDGSAPVLDAGAFLVIGNAAFDAAAWSIVDPSVVFLMGGGYICGRGLANDRAQAVGLVDPDGRPVSSYGGYAGLKPREGQSVERTAPDASDVEASFCYSRSDTGPTPGATNGVSVSGCEQ